MAALTSRLLKSKSPLPENNDDYADHHRLPAGRCNWKNLNIGDTARCGCQRFSDRSKEYGNNTTDKFPASSHHWCMCDHHSCYHDDGSTRNTTVAQALPRTVLPPSQNSSQRSMQRSSPLPSTYRIQGVKSQALIDGAHAEESNQNGHEQIGIGDDCFDVTSYNAYAQKESSYSGLPPIPSQCFLPSDVSSGGLAGEARSFSSNQPGVDFHTSTRAPNLCSPQNAQIPSKEIDTFSRGSPDLGDSGRFDGHLMGIQTATELLAIELSQSMEKASPHAIPSSTVIAIRPAAEQSSTTTVESSNVNNPLRQVMLHLQLLREQLAAHPTLRDNVKAHNSRLDLLENANNMSASDFIDEIAPLDNRLAEIEERVNELEKAQAAMNDASSISTSRPEENASFTSQTSSAMISAAIHRDELSVRIGNLESQVTNIQASALPSYTNPWLLEVVLLPFGSGLRGIWSTLSQFPSQRSRQNSSANDDWTQTQLSNSSKSHTASIKLLLNQSWEGGQEEEMEQEWLVARACGPGSKVEDRLRSRGLVRTVKVTGPDARDVQAALKAAFGEVPGMLLDDLPRLKGQNNPLPKPLRGYHGLQASWIPLRKLHKDSRLRYLDTSEMVTSALWTVMFLTSSVAMRAPGTKRLYVTHRDSYIQNTDGSNADWTWQKLRELPRVVDTSILSEPDLGFNATSKFRSTADVQEADALEECWQYDGRLDPPLSVHSSFASHHSSVHIRQTSVEYERNDSSGSAHSSSAPPSPILSSTDTSIAPNVPLSPLMERHLIRPLHSRTTSMPSMIPAKESTFPGKRRIASFEQEHLIHSTESSPTRLTTLPPKRQRLSRSPSRPRDTPRWSVGPPSPYIFDDVFDQKRGNTPFAYATPHSNAPYADIRPRSAPDAADNQNDHGSTTDDLELGDFDEDMGDSDSELDQAYHIESKDEIWEGVVDEANEDSDQEHKALSVDEEEDEFGSDGGGSSGPPSEYASTQPSALYAGSKGIFHIHVDEDENDEKDNTYEARS